MVERLSAERAAIVGTWLKRAHRGLQRDQFLAQSVDTQRAISRAASGA
jgi:hypothetical protein